jgi:hypothetical protein
MSKIYNTKSYSPDISHGNLMQILRIVSWMLLGFFRIVMHKKFPTSLIEKTQANQGGLKPLMHTMFAMDFFLTHCNEAHKCLDDSIPNAQNDSNK